MRIAAEAARAPRRRDGAKKVVPLVLCVGCGIALLVYVHAYAFAAPFVDDFNLVPIFQAMHGGHLTFLELWRQHGENRMLFPNLVFLASARFDHWNVRHLEYFGALLLIASCAAIVALHRRQSDDVSSWWWAVPVTVLALSLADFEISLWDFESSWAVVLLWVTVALLLLDRSKGLDWPFTGAVCAGIVASFSSLQGLLVWPAAVPYLLGPTRRRPLYAWLASAACVAAAYLDGFHFGYIGGKGPLYALLHPFALWAFLVVNLSSPVPQQPFGVPGMVYAAQAPIGCIVLALALLSLAAWWTYLRQDGRATGAACLVVYGLLVTVVIAIGRVGIGRWQALRSAYSLYPLLVLVGVFLIARELWIARGRPGGTRAAALVAVLVAIQVGFSTVNGIKAGGSERRFHDRSLAVMLDYRAESNRTIEQYLFPGHATYARQQIAEMCRLRLGAFLGKTC